ncbi:T9SS type A sorting domain-containing protein [Crocinitomicaceae bacterium]|nr:T9SS type A sorting domain-containing protein [Crocinitomicaceae bacterium]
MKSLILFICVFMLAISALGQIQLAPLMQNSFLHSSYSEKELSIDSTFVYSTDTIDLPFFDDFTTNKVQEYSPDFNNPLTTSVLYYYLIDQATAIPIENNVGYTNQVTFRRYYDPVEGVFYDTVFNAQTVNVADFSSYPVDYEPVDLYPPYYIYDTLNQGDLSDTIWIENPPYLQDSARQFFLPVSNPNQLWIDDFTYHNYRFADHPRTLGVMTFDGLDASGFPYAIGTTSSGYADVLTSKPIDMSSLSVADSIYISFLYQPQGFGDEPESTDSLILEFYDADENTWNRIWGDTGKSVVPFQIVHLPILGENYFSNGFQFRFRNYGGLSGALDQFHLDMVHVREAIPPAFADTVFKDFSFVYPLNSLISEYTSVPWDHYKGSTENKMTEALEVIVFNGSVGPENYQDGAVEVSYGGITEGNFTLQGFTLAEQQINYAALDFATSFHDLKSGYEFPRNLTGAYEEFDVTANASAQYPNYEPNDSTAFRQGFYNYYSYDDGSAEAAFGPTGSQARLAIHFEAYEPDSIIGLNLCFVPSVNDVSDKLFLLTVWDDNNGEPGEVLYEDDVFNPRSPIYSGSENEYISYFFIDTAKISVGSSFFVGWRQLDPERLNLGFDRNIDHSDEIFYSVDGGVTWLISPFSGSAMLRPVFSTQMDETLGISNPKNERVAIHVYPNPAMNEIQITNSLGILGSQKLLLDATGRILIETKEEKINLESFSSGVYFVRLPELSNSLVKVIKP